MRGQIEPAVDPGTASEARFKQQALVACYLTAITLAMPGWLAAFQLGLGLVTALLFTLISSNIE